ncbi:MAG: hypothetical protein ACRYF3_05390 [Janthinobacterium lividum]
MARTRGDDVMGLLSRLRVATVARGLFVVFVAVGTLLFIAQGVDVRGVPWLRVALLWVLLCAVTLMPWSLVLRSGGRSLRSAGRLGWVALLLSPLFWTGLFTAAFLQPRTGLVCGAAAAAAVVLGAVTRGINSRRARRRGQEWLPTGSETILTMSHPLTKH